jgi:hypothetical protein
MAIAGAVLAANIKDCAYRVHGFFTNHGTIGPGFGFSPILIRFTGFFLFVVFGISCVLDLRSD